MKNLIEVIKVNKSKIFKGTLLVGGLILGGIAGSKALNNNSEEYIDIDETSEPDFIEMEVEVE